MESSESAAHDPDFEQHRLWCATAGTAPNAVAAPSTSGTPLKSIRRVAAVAGAEVEGTAEEEAGRVPAPAAEVAAGRDPRQQRPRRHPRRLILRTPVPSQAVAGTELLSVVSWVEFLSRWLDSG